MKIGATVAIVVFVTFSSKVTAGESVCYGTSSNGALKSACQLPQDGSNFKAYSSLGVWLGRTYVHCAVAEVVETAYRTLAKTHPGKVFVYGETGFKYGGEFKPHKTHQNGLSVDFMVPVETEAGESVPLPTGVMNKLGYSLDFNSRGRLGSLRIDYDAMAAHLEALMLAVERSGIGIRRVIFDPGLQSGLKDTSKWRKIQEIPFSDERTWVRHDEHYHIDFKVRCKPIRDMTLR